MNNLSSVIAVLSEKVERIIQLHQIAGDKIFRLNAENKEMATLLEDHKKKISDLTEKNKLIKLSKSLSQNNDGTLDVKLKINELVREIDKCIAFLNR